MRLVAKQAWRVLAALIAGAACTQPLSAIELVATEKVATIEHAGVPHGRVVLTQQEDAREIRTEEQARIGVTALRAREWRRYELRSRETQAGEPLAVSYTASAGPAVTQTEARIGAGQIDWRRRAGGESTRAVLARPPDLLLTAALQRRIAAQPSDQSWSFEYSEIDFEAARTQRLRLSSDGQRDGDRLALVREALDAANAPPRRLWWSLAQQRLLPGWELAGARFESHACLTDCSEDSLRDYDLLAGLALDSPYRIPVSARRRTLRYVFESADGNAPLLPATGEQQVVRRDARSIVTICADCGDEAAPTPQQLQHYRSPNAWVQSDHPLLRELARSVRAQGSIRGRMHKLVRFVQQHMQGARYSLGYASALQAAQSRSGDCTEYALLLAGLARALGLPARVVGGLAYSSHFAGRGNVFSPHAWVQVWDGRRWVSFDAGIGDFESTHIALAVGDGSAEAYAGLLGRVRQLRLVAAAQIDAPR